MKHFQNFQFYTKRNLIMTKKVNVNVLETYKVYQWKHFEVDQEKIIDKYGSLKKI